MEKLMKGEFWNFAYLSMIFLSVATLSVTGHDLKSQLLTPGSMIKVTVVQKTVTPSDPVFIFRFKLGFWG